MRQSNPLPWSENKDQSLTAAINLKDDKKAEGYFKDLSPFVSDMKNRTFLSIGSGAGEVEIFFAKQWGCKFSYQDPSMRLRSLFDEKLKTENFFDQVLEIQNCRFEDATFVNTYDLIISIHAWYYIERTEAVFKKLRQLMQPGAKALIMIHPRDSFAYTLDAWRSEPLGICAEDLMEMADASSYFTTQIHFARSPVPLDIFFQGQKLTSRGLSFFSFMLERPQQNFSEEEIKTLHQHCIKYSEGESLIHRFGIVELQAKG